MSQTTYHHHPTPSTHVHFSKEAYLSRAHEFQANNITNGLIAGLYGVLVVLCVQSIYALMQRRKAHWQATTIVLSLTIFALFISTTTFVVVTFLNNEASFLTDLLLSAAEMWTYDPPPDFNLQSSVWELQKDYALLYNRTGTAAVMINMILGDAIVWWRACVVWHRNLPVRAACGIFLTATCVLGVLDATLSSGIGYYNGSIILAQIWSGQAGTLFEDNLFGIATCLLSLTTNLVATLLIAFKAWKSRTRLKGYLIAKAGGPSRVEKLFSILIESGAVYCALWVMVVAYQIRFYNYYIGAVKSSSNTEVTFLDVFGNIMNGALVPLIAIYPTIVIVLVASSTRSHMEQGLTVDVRTSRLIAVADTVMIGHAKTGLSRRSDVLLLEGTRHDSGDGKENMGMDTSEELELEHASRTIDNV